jgi:hypothetical protein
MDSIKPGTRCECSQMGHTDHKTVGSMEGQRIGNYCKCRMPAVRMVTVTPGAIRLGEHVPMCEPCATFHEKGA